MMKIQTILEQLTGKAMVDYLIDLLEKNSVDFAEDRKRCSDAVELLRTSALTLSVDDEMEAIYAQTASKFLFSGFLGFVANLDHYMDPVARTFLDVDADVFLREATAKRLPDYEKAQAVRSQFYSLLTLEQRDVYEDIALYAHHLEAVIPKLGHFYGYLLGNTLLPRIVPGYYPDLKLAAQYTRQIEEYLGGEV